MGRCLAAVFGIQRKTELRIVGMIRNLVLPFRGGVCRGRGQGISDKGTQESTLPDGDQRALATE